MVLLLLIIVGYLLGSINPGWIFGKLLKGIDLRYVGTENAGTTNTFRQVGFFPAAITGIFDFAKGLLAIWLAWKLGVKDPWFLAAGIAAFFGHVFPFYLSFRGGQGNATLLGILGFLCYRIFSHIPVPINELIGLGIVALSVYYIARDDEIVGLSVLPLAWVLLIKLLIVNPSLRLELAIILAMFIYMWAIGLRNTIKEKLLMLADHTKKQLLHWRTIARPLAILIPIIYVYTSKETILWILGILGIILIALDLARLVSRGVNFFLFNTIKGLFKEKEKFRFSSMTFFMLAAFLAILLFEKDIAFLAITFIIFGDLAAKFFGAQFTRRIILGERSLEGFVSYFSYCLFFGVFIGGLFSAPFWFVLLGAMAASLTDLFSIFGIDDNFTVALISGAVLTGIRFFVG